MTGERVGKYQVLKRLAVGGMAEIYLARVTGIEGFQKHVVLKKIRPIHAEDPRFVEMFLDEARLAALLHHQNIAQVYDIGQLDGGYFFSMEFLHGQDVQSILKRMVKNRERVPLEYALTIVAGAAAGLHYAHEKRGPSGKPLNIVHRDVSPSNIVVTYDGAVKVVDFGIARAAQRESAETRSGTLKGKISYMSPEQCRGEELDRRSDIFALGIVLYEVTTTMRLFRKGKDSDFLVMQRIVSGEVPRPRERISDYPEELEQVVMRALAIKPTDRYQTARDLLLDLENVAANLRLPLSPARLSAFVESTFGRPAEPWHTDEEADATPEVGHTISTTAAPLGAPQVIEELSSISISVEGATRSTALAAMSPADQLLRGMHKQTAAAGAPDEPELVPWWRKRKGALVAAAAAVVALLGVLMLRSGSSSKDEQPTNAGQTVDQTAPASATEPKTSTKPSSTAASATNTPADPPVSATPAPARAATTPAETSPAETKPAATKPAETAETKPAETKPAETKPAETKPNETKPDETARRTPKRRTVKRRVWRRPRRAATKSAGKKPTTAKKKKKDTLIDTTW